MGRFAAEAPEVLTELEDGPVEFDRWPEVCTVLDRVTAPLGQGPSLVEAFRAADGEAVRRQRRRAALSGASTVLGTVALGVALGHVALGSGPAPTAALVEGACAGAALLIVLTGWWGGLHEHWLLARHRAERLRLLRWGLLVEPRLWSTAADGIERAEREFRESFARVRRLGPLQMGDWASGSWQFLPPAPPGADEGDRDWSDVAAYYRTRRLEPQLAYFREAARRGERWGQLAEIFILGAFFVGVGLELAAVVVGWWSGHEAVARWLLFFGLLLPILAAAARIVRSAFEFGRNEDRCRATAASLERCQGRLDAASDGASIRLSLWASERVLEAEHREWLRLMLKAAWFG